MTKPNFMKISTNKTKINNRLNALVDEKNPTKIRKYLTNLANAFREEREQNGGKNINSLLDNNANDSYFSGAIHAANAMTCKHPDRNIEQVKFWGLGYSSDDESKIAKVPFDEPTKYMFANIAGNDVDTRRDWLKENNIQIVQNFEANNTKQIRDQFVNIMNNLYDMNVSQKELVQYLNTTPDLLKGILASAHWQRSGSPFKSEIEYAGLGTVAHTSNKGNLYTFDKNQMQHALTPFINSSYTENAGEHSELILPSKKIIPFSELNNLDNIIRREKLSAKGDPREIDYNSPFNPENASRGIRELGGTKPGLDFYDNQ